MNAQEVLTQAHQRTCLGMFITGVFWGQGEGSKKEEGMENNFDGLPWDNG